MFSVFTIARNTFTEVIRQPIYLIVLGCTLFLLLSSPYLTAFAMMENNKMLKDMGLATLLLAGLVIAAFSASSVIYQEIENKTALIVISKPIKRAFFVLGKYLGIFWGLLVAEFLLSTVLIQVVRTEITEARYSKSDYPVLLGFILAIVLSLLWGAYNNFFFEKSFTSSTVLIAIPIFSCVFLGLCLVEHNWTLQPFAKNLDTNVVKAAVLVFLATALLSAIAVAASTRFSPMSTLGICIFFFFLGLFSDYLFGQWGKDYWWASVCYQIIPNLQIYWVVDALLDDRDIPFSYIVYILSYTLFFLFGILSIAIAMFQERELQN